MGRQAGRYDDDETVRRRSGWLIPLIVFALTAALSAGLMLYYLRPPSLGAEPTVPTSRSDTVAVSVSGRPFNIPANYLMYDSTRTGGEKPEIAIFALLPDLSGWSNWAADEFTSNAPDSRVVYLTLHQDRLGLKETDKLARVYQDYFADRRGFAGPYGLHQYAFRTDTGYRAEDLFVGQSPAGPVVLRCVKQSDAVPSPSCLRETLVAPGVALSLRFKRAHLEDWQDITAKTDKLIAGFIVPVRKK